MRTLESDHWIEFAARTREPASTGEGRRGVELLGAFGTWPTRLAGRRFRSAIVQGVRHQADPENRLLALVEQLHFPLRIAAELATDSTDHVGAGTGELLPSRIVIGQLDAMLRRARITAVSNPKEIERH